MTRFALLLLLAGCRQLFGFDDPALQPGSDGSIDTPRDTATAPIDEAAGPLCGASLIRSVVCFTFDGNTLDGSGNNNHAVAPTPLTFVPGVSGEAIDTSLADLQIADASSLDLAALTIRMKVKPLKYPDPGDRFGLYDNNRYRMHVRDDGFVRCAVNSGATEVFSGEALPLGAFTRVTCTYDASSLRLYFDGVQQAALNSAMAFGSVTGSSSIGRSEPTGENFQGVIDELEIFDGIVTNP